MQYREGDRQEWKNFRNPSSNPFVWGRVTPPAKHVAPRSSTAAKKPRNAHLGKVQPIVGYPEYNPLDSNQEFSTTQNSSRLSKMEVSAMSKEVQSAHSTTLTEGGSKRAGHPGPILDEEMISNNFEIGFDDDLNAIFGVG